jgi:hypothetical protein
MGFGMVLYVTVRGTGWEPFDAVRFWADGGFYVGRTYPGTSCH